MTGFGPFFESLPPAHPASPATAATPATAAAPTNPRLEIWLDMPNLPIACLPSAGSNRMNLADMLLTSAYEKRACFQTRDTPRFSFARETWQSRRSRVHRALSVRAGRAFWLGDSPHSNGPCPGFPPGSLVTLHAEEARLRRLPDHVLVKFVMLIICLYARAPQAHESAP